MHVWGAPDDRELHGGEGLRELGQLELPGAHQLQRARQTCRCAPWSCDAGEQARGEPLKTPTPALRALWGPGRLANAPDAFVNRAGARIARDPAIARVCPACRTPRAAGPGLAPCGKRPAIGSRHSRPFNAPRLRFRPQDMQCGSRCYDKLRWLLPPLPPPVHDHRRAAADSKPYSSCSRLHFTPYSTNRRPAICSRGLLTNSPIQPHGPAARLERR